MRYISITTFNITSLSILIFSCWKTSPSFSGLIRSTCTQAQSLHFQDTAPGFGCRSEKRSRPCIPDRKPGCIHSKCRLLWHFCQVYGLGDGVVRIFLEGCLNSHMLLRRDIQRCDEQILQILGHSGHILDRALSGQLHFQIRGCRCRVLAAMRSKSGETSKRRAPSSTCRTKARANKRFDAAARPRDDADGSGGCDCSHSGVSHGVPSPEAWTPRSSERSHALRLSGPTLPRACSEMKLMTSSAVRMASMEL